MQIECRQEHLARALQIVSRMVGTRGTLPVLGNILLATEKGRLKIAATDLEVGIQTWIGGKVNRDGALTIPARLLVDFIGTNSDQLITLSTKDTALHLQSEHYEANIKGIDASEFPLIPDIKRTEPIVIDAHTLKETIQQTAFATAIDETRPILTGIFLKIDGKQIKIVATDSYRLSERTLNLKSDHPALQVIIPARTLQELGRILSDSSDEVKIYVSDNQILFIFQEVELISRLIDGTFPDYEQILPKQTTTTVQLEKSRFQQVMKMASYFARETANNVQFKVESDGVLVSAISPQLGDTVSRLAGTITGEPVEIAFNAKFILDALAVLPGEELLFTLSGKLQPGILRSNQQKDYLYLIMPLRIDS